MISRAFCAPASLALFSAVLLTGCGMGIQDTSGGAVTGHFQGQIIGGQQPVAHATVQLYAVNTGVSSTGYNGAAKALLTPAVTSDANGGFNISNQFTCPSATAQVYITATLGNPGLSESSGTVNNNALALVAALGNCSTLQPTTHIILNEVTTVAAAWALAGFATDYDHVGTSSGNTVGLANAFGMASNLASYATGASPGSVPAGALVPADEVNYMANVLAACVNTKGYTVGDLSACDNLFKLAKPASGAAPTNTFAAALDIARNPGHNVALIAALPTPQAPFQTSSGYTAPTDWTMAITFSIGPTVATNIAIDAGGNVWSVAPDGLYELSATGVKQPSYSSLAGNTVAFDPSGNIWVALSGSSQIAKMPANLSAPTVYDVATSGGGTGVGALAIDGSGDIWYTCSACLTVNELKPDGTAKAQSLSNGGGSITTVLSIDPSENVWVGNFISSGYYVLKPDATYYPSEPFSCGAGCGRSAFIANDHAGQAWFVGYNLTLASGVQGTTTNIDPPNGGIFNPAAVAIDGAGSAWVANTSSLSGLTPGSISAFDTTGAALSPSTGYASSTLATPQGIAVDGSGNVWVRNSGAATVTAFVGAATPVVTPFSLGLQNGTLGQKP